MATPELSPDSPSPPLPNRVSEVMTKLQANLSVLVSLSPVKLADGFLTAESYTAYINGLRYIAGLGSKTTTMPNGFTTITPGTIMTARRLQAEGENDWQLNLFRPGDSFNTSRDIALPHYVLNLFLTEARHSVPRTMVTITNEDGSAGSEPTLSYRDKRGLISGEVVIEPYELETSYPFRVVTQVANQLERQADAMLSLGMDSITP